MATKKKAKGKKVSKKAKKKIKAKKTKSGKQKSSERIKPVPAGKVLGIVTHYFPQVQAAVIKLKKPLAVGDSICIKGTTTDIEQRVESMQIDRVPIQKAKKGDEIGLQVIERVREHDLVLLPS